MFIAINADLKMGAIAIKPILSKTHALSGGALHAVNATPEYSLEA